MTHTLVDFGPAATDYARHRPGFPDVFFDHVSRYGIGTAGQQVLDLGTGTGTLARGFTTRGCQAIGLDPSPAMLSQAVALDRTAGVTVAYVLANAEQPPFGDARFDVVCAGQCWHWFDRERAAAEVARVLRPGGLGLIAYFNYLTDAGTLGTLTEAVILQHNPSWPYAGHDGRYPSFASDLSANGLSEVDIFWFDVDLRFTQESWRGRVRACNALLTIPAEKAVECDAHLAAVLARDHPDPLLVPHRIFGIVVQKPTAGR